MSARTEFLATLRAGMRGASPMSIDEAAADYSAHFEEGLRAGRSEAQIAAALGDPLALAEELRLASHAGAWQATPGIRTATTLVTEAASLGKFRRLAVYLLAPIVIPALTLLCFAGVAGIAGGLWFLFAGHDFGIHGGAAVVWLAGVGMIAGGVSVIAVALLATVCAINTLARRVRRPALHPTSQGVTP
jgi:uncharacterized membrane protein